MTDTLIGNAPLPGSGEGVVLRYRRSDCGVLQTAFGDGWFVEAHERLNKFDMKYIEKCIEIGAKKDGKPHKVGIDDLDAPIIDVAIAILHGLYIAVHGKTFEKYVEEIDAKIKAAQKASEPEDPSPSGPESSSNI